MAYAAKHSLGIDFKHTGRTFRLAKTENRDTWFIAMHPKPSVTCEDSRPHHNVTQGLAADNGMLKERATCLAAYITDTFKDPMLIGHWVEPKLEWETHEPPPGADEDSSEDKNSEYSDEDVSMEYHEEIPDSDEDVDMDDSTSSQCQTNRVPSSRTWRVSTGEDSHRHRRRGYRGRRAACLAAQDQVGKIETNFASRIKSLTHLIKCELKQTRGCANDARENADRHRPENLRKSRSLTEEEPHELDHESHHDSKGAAVMCDSPHVNCHDLFDMVRRFPPYDDILNLSVLPSKWLGVGRFVRSPTSDNLSCEEVAATQSGGQFFTLVLVAAEDKSKNWSVRLSALRPILSSGTEPSGKPWKLGLADLASVAYKSPEQEQALERIMNDADPALVVVLPTGGGKSLLFTAPACLEYSSMTIVVVPYRQLITETVNDAVARGIEAMEWTPLLQAPVDLVVVSADNLTDQFFHYTTLMTEKGWLRRVFLDECHLAITAHSWRPKLTRLPKLRSISAPTIMLTATLPLHMERELKETMLLVQDLCWLIRASTARKSFRYMVKSTVADGKLIEEAIKVCQGTNGRIAARGQDDLS
ncbi:hypothetical protein E4U13_001989 [Claviceps humidiphila]|uniref:Helicase ATP-binding domain-containing protein n=1 Tax=Claviceps humidiphila TaxID=1294629 RepID=A0A9P7TUS9_9HYPO|nr:hypothetical protein E4U13_001989 [Claviceps humidiphila]